MKTYTFSAGLLTLATITTATPVTSTVTSTSTATTNTTTVVPQPTCTTYGPFEIGCSNNSVCSIQGVCKVAGSEDECSSSCINDSHCVAYSYDGPNRSCNTFADCCP